MSKLLKLYLITGIVLNIIVLFETKKFDTQGMLYLLLAGPLAVIAVALVALMELVRVMIVY